MSSSAGSDGAESPLPVVPVICGPTAAGKSAVAMWLSLRREIVVVSADSRQIYRGFDIGTAKPSTQDRARVPHRGIDVADATQRFSAAQWTDVADQAIREALDLGRIPVVVGGTGFYVATLFRPLWAEPALDPARRAAVQRLLDAWPTAELRRWCETLDPARAHLGRAQLLRAVEVALLTGRRLSALHVERARPPRYAASYLLVDAGTELQSRIVARAERMLECGWLEEVRRLSETVAPDAPAWKATGYAVVRQHAAGDIDRSTALERVVVETRQYAKRQRTWFRHQVAHERVRRLVSGAAGWQEAVDEWITEWESMHERGERAR